MRSFQLVAGLAAALGVLLSFLYGPTSGIADPAVRMVRFFSYFTILTNLGLAAMFLLPVLAGGSWAARFVSHRTNRFTLATAILIVGTVYQTLLIQDLWTRTGFSFVASIICHYLTPLLALADWILRPPKTRLGIKSCLAALAYPLLYLCWTMLHGANTGWYPYPFLDAGRAGWWPVAKTSGILAAGFLVAGAFLILVQRVRSRRASS